MERMNTREYNKCKFYSILIRQCTEAMHTELKVIDNFKERYTAFDFIWFLEQVKIIS